MKTRLVSLTISLTTVALALAPIAKAGFRWGG